MVEFIQVIVRHYPESILKRAALFILYQIVSSDSLLPEFCRQHLESFTGNVRTVV